MHQPRTSRSHGHHDHIITGAHQGTLASPLSLSILLVRKDDASCHLRRRQGAQHSSQPACAADGHGAVPIKAEQPASTEDAWWHASDNSNHSSSADKEGSHLIHLAHVTNSFVPTAAGACLRAAHTTITFCRMSSELPTVLVERPEVPKYITRRCGGKHTHTQNR